MLSKEILKKIKWIEINSRKPVNQLFAGEYRSVFKGQGLEFFEVREYQPGDDIRSIDWNVTARLGAPFVKKYIEERQRTIILMVDVSASLEFGSLKKSKNEIAAEVASLLAFSAVKNNDLVGLVLFSGRIEKFIPPKKGRKHVLRIIRDILCFKNAVPAGRQEESGGTDISQAVKYLSRVVRKKAILFLISDFLADNYEKSLNSISRKHDLIPIIIKDRFEKSLPNNAGLVYFEDPETKDILPVDLDDPEVKTKYINIAKEDYEKRKKYLRGIKSDIVELSTDGEYIKPLSLFFKKRERRMRLV
ncbi:MAG: hypothetical protein FD145_1474 [Candidatus Saganbacteria bacterium]|uniref:DUF58 domain-containing protein n=1 Tax=Candidatus Saganbacteria bacterium TaxID=2575572 RepID=A0A833L2P2_UNCSA|nr:MAG: hypothetical protein FD145_1474 [Candidatus Saganbacteria bacterium]